MQRVRSRSHEVQHDPHRKHNHATAKTTTRAAKDGARERGRGRDNQRPTSSAGHATVNPTRQRRALPQ
eukprot:10207608-Alexandrium_andersonii.AAC.1